MASVLLAAGTVFTVEMLQRFFSQDYRSLAALNSASSWPTIPLFGRQWGPVSFLTWSVPVAFLAAGVLLIDQVRRVWTRLIDKVEGSAA